MEYHYTSQQNIQMVVYLLKAYKIKRVIASPGATNVELVASLQQDSFFEMYSCVDERSAAYMACGIAAESGEPVVLSCTGATSARNYMPGLTEAYYRKLPVIAITSTQDISNVGHLIAQVTDRSQRPNDIVIDSVHIQQIKDAQDAWDVNIKLNQVLNNAIQKQGPIHINLTKGRGDFNTKELPEYKVIKRYRKIDLLPEIAKGKIGIFVGEHKNWNLDDVEILERFCKSNNAVVFCDHTSKYYGAHRCQYALIGAQESCQTTVGNMELMIHIGEMSGDYDSMSGLNPQKVWRVSEDGLYKDTFKRLDAVFEMKEVDFFNAYIESGDNKDEYIHEVTEAYNCIISQLPDFPLSNIYVAQKLNKLLPTNSVVYLGILNTLRSWNYFNVPAGVHMNSNVGGFGIDGNLSSLVGSSMVFPNKLHVGIVGDLSFFYDMNCIGNRDIKNNLRIIVINNGHGQEFTNYIHVGPTFGDDTNLFIAARGHYGAKSFDLVKHYAQDLGFEYFQASDKDSFNAVYKKIVCPNSERPILLEVFTTEDDENTALHDLRNAQVDSKFVNRRRLREKLSNVKSIIKSVCKS